MSGYIHILLVILVKTLMQLVLGIFNAIKHLLMGLVATLVAGVTMFGLYCKVRSHGWSHADTAVVMHRLMRRKHYAENKEMMDAARSFLRDEERKQKFNRVRAAWGLPQFDA